MQYFFTSINNAYLPKAIILAKSLRRSYGDGAHITCMLSDAKRADLDYSAFDDVLTIDQLDLPVPSLEAWVFKHAVVELCTAVKPWAFKKIFAKHQAETIVYLDPDTVVYSPLAELNTLFEKHPIILTPHVTVPAKQLDDLLDGEMLGSLRHGVFNLGFLALANQGQGIEFLDWWANRCLDWCYDDASRGLFTDQRWIDLAPCFFDSLLVLRHPGYNMATWNLYYRKLGSVAGEGCYTVNTDYPLRFFHFSGFDIGTHELMLKKHGRGDVILANMTNDYVAQQDKNGQSELGKRPGVYDFYGSGTKIEKKWRIFYRENADLVARFSQPYSDSGLELWLKANYVDRQPSRQSIVGLLANRVRQHPDAILWLNKHLPVGLKGWLRRKL